MNMIDILKGRLPKGIAIVSVKEKPSKYIVSLSYNGEEIDQKTELVKACVPGKENAVCDTAIQVVMTAFMLDRGEIEEAKRWMEYAKRAEESKPKMEELVRDYAEACKRYKSQYSPLSNNVSALNDVSRAQRALLRAVLDENGYNDVEMVD